MFKEGRIKRLGILLIVLIGLFCCLPRFFLWIIDGQPAPAPIVYPGVEPTVIYQSPGSCCQSQGRYYTVNAALPRIQSFYEMQLALTCKDDWEFKALPEEGYVYRGLDDLSRYKSTGGCRIANCEIRRLNRAQWFSVVICANGETESFVFQWNTWED
jgi:hypothetical protein